MASSSTNPSQDADNLNDNSNQWSTTVEERKQYSSTSINGEEIIEEQSVTIVTQKPVERQDELSPNLIQKQYFSPLAAQLVSARTFAKKSKADISIAENTSILSARPFDEFLIPQTNTDASSGTIPKPNDQKPSSGKKT